MIHQQYTKNQTNSHYSSFPRWFQSIALGVISVASLAMPVKAQKTLYFVFPPLKESLRVESLETFAQDGTVNKDLGFYLKLAKADEEARIKFREALNLTSPVEPLLISRFFRSQVGEAILEIAGQYIQIEGAVMANWL